MTFFNCYWCSTELSVICDNVYNVRQVITRTDGQAQSKISPQLRSRWYIEFSLFVCLSEASSPPHPCMDMILFTRVDRNGCMDSSENLYSHYYYYVLKFSFRMDNIPLFDSLFPFFFYLSFF